MALPYTASDVKVLGIDLGYRSGYALLEVTEIHPRLVDAGLIESNEKNPPAQRLVQLYTGLCEVLDELKPDVVVLEEVYVRFPKSAIALGGVKGVYMLACAQRGLIPETIQYTEVKLHLAGDGSASKDELRKGVERALRRRFHPGPNDVSDACGAALVRLIPAVERKRVRKARKRSKGPAPQQERLRPA